MHLLNVKDSVNHVFLHALIFLSAKKMHSSLWNIEAAHSALHIGQWQWEQLDLYKKSVRNDVACTCN